MGRDPGGEAKIINVDENGNVKVQQSGTIMALDPVTGEPKPVSVVEDNDGNYVLRTVDAAPFGYNRAKDAYKVEYVEPYKIVTLANAVEVRSATYPLNRYLESDSHMTSEEIREYRNFRISIYSTHDQVGLVRICGYHEAFGECTVLCELFRESAALPATNARVMFAPQAPGNNSSNYFTIPALSGMWSDILVQIEYPVAPTTGSITIVVEMWK